MRRAALAISTCLALAPTGLLAFEIALPPNATETGELTRPQAGFLLPVSPVADGTPGTIQLAGTPSAESYRFPLGGRTTAQIMTDLRAQVQAEGFTTLLDCAARTCGGFDFRYSLNLLPEPKMHVDLGDYRFLSAVRRGEDGDDTHLQLVVSRSPSNGFVQITTISPTLIEPELTQATKSPDPALIEDVVTDDLGKTLLSTGRAVLSGVAFETGSSELAEGSAESLADLAEFLRENPDLTVALVGHTDAEGSLDANLALSRRRAASVLRELQTGYGIPGSVLEAEGVGYLAPLVSNATEEGRQKNRRVEVVITSTR